MNWLFLDLPGFRKLLTDEPSFGGALARVASSLNLDASLIANIMSLESGMNPRAINPDGGATGLIQFMPKTAVQLGTTVEALRQMNGVQQLEYVKKFFLPHAPRIRSQNPGDYYMAVFMPAYLGMPKETVLGEKGSTEILPKTNLTKGQIYASNVSLDVDHNGIITIGDITAKAEQRAALASSKPRLEVADVPLAGAPPSAPQPSSLPPAWRSSGGPSDLPVLRIGAKGSAVAMAQLLLGCDVITGVYTDAMATDYVRPFQARQGLSPDAVIGRVTWEAIASIRP